MRNEGFYWVKYEGKWGIAYWYCAFTDAHQEWEWAYISDILYDHHFEEIDENQIVRKEQMSDEIKALWTEFQSKQLDKAMQEFRDKHGKL